MATKLYRIENLKGGITTLITIEVRGKHNEDCAGWYIRNGEVIAKRWPNQPNYKFSDKKMNEAKKINLFITNYPDQGMYTINKG